MIVSIILSSNIGFGQSKKDLRLSVLRLQSDSTSLDNKLKEGTLLISSLNSEISSVQEVNKELNKQIGELTIKKETISNLTDSIARLNLRLDSINRYSKIIHFVKTFYNSLELNDDENLRKFEQRDFKFDLENFHALVTKNARYNTERVKNLSDENLHDKYFIELQSIEEIKFSLGKILIKTRVMYSGDNMGLFYNEEQLTLRENKGLLKLTDWVDLDLYKMMPSMEASVDNFTREDFYKWLDNINR